MEVTSRSYLRREPHVIPAIAGEVLVESRFPALCRSRPYMQRMYNSRRCKYAQFAADNRVRTKQTDIRGASVHIPCTAYWRDWPANRADSFRRGSFRVDARIRDRKVRPGRGVRARPYCRPSIARTSISDQWAINRVHGVLAYRPPESLSRLRT